METFPKFDLFPRLTKVTEGVRKFIFPEVQLHMSNHYVKEHFEEPYQPELPFGEN